MNNNDSDIVIYTKIFIAFMAFAVGFIIPWVYGWYKILF